MVLPLMSQQQGKKQKKTDEIVEFFHYTEKYVCLGLDTNQ